jgi:pimeloyl-ACP methyl ester carboxylesterase
MLTFSRVVASVVTASLCLRVPVSQAAQLERQDPSLRPTRCAFEIPLELQARIRCFTFAVPRDYEHPADGTFDLAVAVRTAERPAPARRPLLILHGGPGGAGLVRAIGRLVEASPGATMVVFDQRGMGLSAPHEVCSDISSTLKEAIAGPGDAFTTAWRSQEPTARCRARLERIGVQPHHFGTRVTSRDADELRRALRVERWDVLSVSYGTVVALDMLAGYPQSVASVLLDSPVGGQEPSAATHAADRTDLTMRNIFAACVTDTACARAHPEFESRFRETFDSVDANHLLVPIPDANIPGVTVADINGAELDYLVRRLRRNVSTIGSIPRIMRAARNRDAEALRPLVMTAMAAVPEDALPGRPAIFCRDIATLHRPRIPRTALEMNTTTFCGVWGPPGQPPRLPRAGNSWVLMLIGGLDPLFEPSVAEEIEVALGSRVRSVVFPASGHALLAPGCVQQIVAAFFAYPGAVPDTRCVEPRPRIVFEQ